MQSTAAKNITNEIDDRRNALRQNVQSLSIKVDCIKGEGMSAHLLDVSRTGIRFRINASIPSGTPVVAYPPEGYDLAPINATVLRTRIVDTPEGGAFEYGVHFDDAEELRRHSWWLQLRQRR